MWAVENRWATFSSQPCSDDPAGTFVSWPHISPLPEKVSDTAMSSSSDYKPNPTQLANAGFFFRPYRYRGDNCECFHCGVQLDAWDPKDDPITEHLAHRDFCAWAKVASKQGNPADPEMLAARIATFGDRWPHEKKPGWKCKTSSMAAAGWSYHPGPGAQLDGVRCWYCDIALDDFEPQDDP